GGVFQVVECVVDPVCGVFDESSVVAWSADPELDSLDAVCGSCIGHRVKADCYCPVRVGWQLVHGDRCFRTGIGSAGAERANALIMQELGEGGHEVGLEHHSSPRVT